MEDKIEVNEYVRFNNGEIGKVIDIKENPSRIVYSEYGEIGLISDIVKHSKHLTDLIENKDVLKVRTDKEIMFLGIDEDTTDIKYKELIEDIKNGEYELLEILTHEQFEQNSYKVGGENETSND